LARLMLSLVGSLSMQAIMTLFTGLFIYES
jgi:hypothetical protein